VSNTKNITDWTPAEFVVRVASTDATTDAKAKAEALATSLGAPLLDEATAPDPSVWQLIVSHDLPTLRRPDGVDWQIDYRTGKARHRANEQNSVKQPLAKALGISKLSSKDRSDWHILDGTAGAGADAWQLASTGATVTMIEQHAVLFALLKAAVSAARNDFEAGDTADRLTVIHGNVESVLTSDELLLPSKPNAIYLDPMYPVRRSSAAVKKPMQFIQALVGKGPDPEELLLACLGYLADSELNRVVVKRPSDAGPLVSDWNGQLVSVDSGAARFDVYLDP